MESFNFFFSFYGLLLGFSVAAIVKALATMVSQRAEQPVSAISALLGIFLLQDMATLWIFAWDTRSHLTVNYLSIYGALVVASLYYVAVTLAFPSATRGGASFEAHYWQNKRLVVGAVILGSSLTLLHAAAVGALAGAEPVIFWTLQAIYWLPLLGLLFTKSRSADTGLLAVLVVGYLAEPAMEAVGKFG